MLALTSIATRHLGRCGGNPVRTLALILLLAGAEDANAGTVLTTVGIVQHWEGEKGTLWFEFVRSDQRFILVEKTSPDAGAIVRALLDSHKTGRSVTVHYYLDSGAIDAQTGKAAFLVREIKYDGRTLRGAAKDRKVSPSNRPKDALKAEGALIRGVALNDSGRYAEARVALDVALEGNVLPPRLRALAHKTRGNAISDDVSARELGPTEEGDRQLVVALADLDAWVAAEPEDAQALYALAFVLRALGAYDDALEIYAQIARKWEDESFWSAVRISSTYRQLGDYAKALATLEALAATNGPRLGMAFHYHRGSTLIKLKRYEEAVKEFTEGLKSQPDYTWAFIMRACAHAGLGRLHDALDDQERGLRELRAGSAFFPLNAATRQNLERANAVATELRAAVKEHPQTPTLAPCTGYWDYSEQMRPRSPFLPPRPKAGVGLTTAHAIFQESHNAPAGALSPGRISDILSEYLIDRVETCFNSSAGQRIANHDDDPFTGQCALDSRTPRRGGAGWSRGS